MVRLVPRDDARHDGEVDVEEVVERFQTWVAQSDTVVFEGGTDTRIEWCAGPVEDLLGYSTDELIGTSGFDHLHPDDLQLATQVLERDDPVSRFDMRLMRKDGTTRWVRMTLVPVRDSAGAITKWRGGWRDIQAQHEAESALTESVERLTAVLESASVGMCLVAPDGAFMEVNPAMCDLMDRDEATLLSLSWREITHPDDLAADQSLRREVLDGKRESFRLVKRYLHPDGQVIWGDLSVGCVRDDSGAVRYFVSQIVDISDSARAHVSLELERRQLKATLDSELDPRVVFEAVRDEVGSIVDFEYVQANARAPDYLGIPEGELIGMRLRSLFPSSAAEEVVEMYSRVVETGEPLAVDDYVYPSELYEGQERWYDVRGARLGDGLSLTWRDVTDRHETAARLAESEAHYRLLAEQTTDVVGIGDNTGVIRWLSPSITRALGWQPHELVGRNFADMVHPDDLATIGRARQEVQADRNAAMKVRLRERSGKYRWFDIRLDPQHAPDGSVVGRIARWRDVDSEVAAQDALLRAQQRLSEAMEAEDDPRCLLEAVRDEAGVVTDFRFTEVNSALCSFVGRRSVGLIGELLTEVVDLTETTRVAALALVADSGRSLVVDEVELTPFPGAAPVIVDFRCFRVGDGVSISFRDVTERVRSAWAIAEAEQRYRTLVERMADVVIATDAEGRITYAAEPVTDLLGYEPTELVGRRVLSLLHEADLPAAAESTSWLWDTGSGRYRARILRFDGTYSWVDVKSQVLRDAMGAIVGGIGVWRDANEAQRLESELAGVTDHLGDVVLHLADGVITWASPSATDTLADPGDLAGIQVSELVHPSDRTSLIDNLTHLPSGGRVRHRWRFFGPGRSPRWFDAVISAADEAGRAVMSLRSADDDVAQEIALRHMAGSDSLTGLANRRALTGRLSAILDHRRTGEQTAVLYCDLDNLKQINDTAGHGAGDKALLTIARRIREEIRSEDIVARVGGDEFVVVLTGVHSLTEAVTIAEQVRAAVAAPISVGDRSPVTSTVSIGVTLAAADEDPQALLERADAAMYEAKRSGRNRVVAR